MTNQDNSESHLKLELSNTSPLRTLAVFKDDPLFTGSEDDSSSDIFHHKAFAETIYKLLISNTPPLSVGLFGSWGIGKSTIVNILFQIINAREGNDYKTIYFNSWKYSGDSFRRQFLIEVASQIYGRDSDIVSRLQQLNYVDVLKRSRQRDLLGSLTQAIKEAVDVRLAFRPSTVARFLMGCTTMLVVAAIAGIVSKFSPVIAALILSIIAPAIFLWFSTIKFDELFVFQEAPMYDPKLIFPEQFEKEFSDLVSSEALNGQKAVIAIDDLDRCEPKVVQDILVSMKNFTGHKNCFFIVPCDDKTIAGVFTEPAQKAGYKDELLRKYFNVGIRIPPITSTDLVDFANTTARNTGLPLEVVQIAALANCRDARKMKHFLNGFVLKYQLAKAREAAHLMPSIVDDNLVELAKAVLIEDAFPDLFARIVQNPRIYSILERGALDGGVDQPELQSLKLENWETEFDGLKEILQKTRDVPMAHADVFFSLKSTNQEAKVPRGIELRNAVIEGNAKLIEEITKGIEDSSAKTATADLLIDLISQNRGPFLQRAIAGSLSICFGYKLLGPDTKRVSIAITNAILYQEKMFVLVQQPNLVLDCAVAADREDLIVEKFFGEITGFANPAPPINIHALIAALYRLPDRRLRLAELFNEKFMKWVDTQDGLIALESLRIPFEIEDSEKIPSFPVVTKVLEMMIPQFSDVPNNTIRRSIVFANWFDGYAPRLLRVLVDTVQAIPPSNDYGPGIEFVIDSVLSNTRLVEYPEAVLVWNTIPSIYNRVTDARGKIEIGKAMIVFAALSTEISVRAQAKSHALNLWQTLSDEKLRESLGFLRSLPSSETQSLCESALQQEYAAIKSEMETPTDRTIQRVAFCMDYPDFQKTSSMVDLFIAALEVSKDESLLAWLDIIKQHETALNPEFQVNLATRCKELALSYRFDKKRQQILITTMVIAIGKMPENRKREFTQGYFAFLKSSHPHTRNAAAAALGVARSSISDIQEFKIQVGGVLGDLRRDLVTQELIPFRTVLDSLVAQGDIFDTSEWHEVGELGKRLLSQPDLPNQEFGMDLVDKIPGDAESLEEKLLHVLVSVEKSSSILKDRATTKLNQMAKGGLSEAASSVLKDRGAENADADS